MFVLLASALIYETQCVCRLVINELNIINPKYVENNDYIELKQLFGQGNEMSMRGYKLIGFNCNAKSGTIDTVVSLWNFSTNKKGFFTIGGSDVKSADVNIPNEMIKTPSSFSRIKMHSMSNYFGNVRSELRAFALLYEKDNSFREIALNEKTKVLPINDKLVELLKKYLIDLVVYTGDKGTCDKCELIERIYSEYGQRKYVLRETKSNLANNDISLNRCASENIGFLPEMFKLGNPTPGAENDCTGPHFILEENILEATSLLPSNTQSSYIDDNELDQSCSNENQPRTTCDDQLTPGCSGEPQPICTSSIPQLDYSHTTTSSILQTIEQLNASSITNTCTSLLLHPDGDRDAAIIERENNRKRTIGDGADYSEDHEWSTTTHFQ